MAAAALSPAPELLSATLAAAARWSAATGLDLPVGVGGLPVQLKPIVVRMPDGTAADVDPQLRGTPTCGALTTGGEIWMSEAMTEAHGCAPMAELVAHELGHALGIHSHLGGLMASPQAPGGLIDSDALEAVCVAQPCSVFNPEL